MEQAEAVAGGQQRPLASPRTPRCSSEISPLFQGTFKHYNADQSGFINSYEMRNAVNDAGDQRSGSAGSSQRDRF